MLAVGIYVLLVLVLAYLAGARALGTDSVLGATHLRVNMTNCQIELTLDDSLGSTETKIDYLVNKTAFGTYAMSSDTAGGTTNIEVADGRLWITAGRAALIALEFNCDRSEENQIMVRDIKLAGTFSVSCGKVDLEAVRVEAASFYAMASGTGSLVFEDVFATDRAAGIDASVQEGTIVVSPRRSNVSMVNLNWTSPCAYVCLPEGRYVDDSDCAANPQTSFVPSGSQQCLGRGCAGYYANISLSAPGSLVAPRFDPGASQVDVSPDYMNVKVRNDDGSIYLHDAAMPDGVTETDMSSLYQYRQDNTNISMSLTDGFRTRLDDYMVNKPPFEDIIIIIEMTPFLDNAYVIYTSKPVYTEMYLGLLAMVSSRLLAPSVTRLRGGRLAPGFCPYEFHPSDWRRGQAVDLLHHAIDPSTPPKERVDRTAIRNTTGTFGFELEVVNSDFQRTIAYVVHEFDIDVIAYVSVALSILLGALAGIVLAYSTLTSIMSYVVSHAKERQLLKRIYGLFNELDASQDGSAAAAAKQHADQGDVLSGGQRKKATKKQKAKQGTKATVYTSLSLGRGFYEFGSVAFNTLSHLRRNSLEEFAAEFAKEHYGRLTDFGVPRTVFLQAYEKYCLQKELPVISCLENFAVLEGVGYYQELTFGNATEVFVRLQWKPMDEIQPLPDDPSPSDTSLDLFIDSEAMLTPFDSDVIPVMEFRTRYAAFIAKHGLIEFPITPRSMERYQSKMIRKRMTYYRMFPQNKPGKDGGWSLWAAVTHPRSPFVLIFEVIAHMLLTLLIPVPILLVAQNVQAEVVQYELPSESFLAQYWSLFEPSSFVELDSLPMRHPDEVAAGAEAVNFGIMCFYALACVELVHHYMFVSGSIDELSVANNESHTGWGRTFHGYTFRLVFHILLFLIASADITVVALMFVWAVLGAVVNPVKYLVYASGASVFIFVMLDRVTVSLAMRESIGKKIQALISARVDTFLKQQQTRNRQATMEQETDEGEEERFLDRRSKLEFRKLIEETGLDRSDVDILGLAQGKSGSITALAGQLGVDSGVFQLLVSIARRDQDELLDAAFNLGPKIGVHSPLARSLVNLANSWSKESGRQGIKLLVNTLTESAEDVSIFVNMGEGTPFNVSENVRKKLAEPVKLRPDGTKLPRFEPGDLDEDINATIQILPEIAESMLAITEDSDFDPFEELIKEHDLIQDAFRPVPMQLFDFLEDFFTQNDKNLKHSLMNLCERMLVSDAVALHMGSGSKAKAKDKVRVSKMVDKLSKAFGTERQLADVLNKIFTFQIADGGSKLHGGAVRFDNFQTDNGRKLTTDEKVMVKTLIEFCTELPVPGVDGLLKPIQSLRHWLGQNCHKAGEVTKFGKQFVLLYQMMSIIDGLFAVWTNNPVNLGANRAFCNEVLCMEPEVAAAFLALLNSKEGGVNQDSELKGTSTDVSMNNRILTPLAKQLSKDLGASLDPGDKRDATEPELLEHQINDLLAGFLTVARGRRVDFTRLVKDVGIDEPGAVVCGSLMNGTVAEPLIVKLAPLCNKLDVKNSAVIVACIQCRRQTDMADFTLGCNVILPLIGVRTKAAQAVCRCLVQLALSGVATYTQHAMVELFPDSMNTNADLQEVQRLAMRLTRSRRSCTPGEGPFYVAEKALNPFDSAVFHYDADHPGVSHIPGGPEKNKEGEDITQILTRVLLCDEKDRSKHKAPPTEPKEKFYEWMLESFPGVEELNSVRVCNTLFDLITFLIQLGEDTQSLKTIAQAFKVKSDVLKAMVQIPLYPGDAPVRQVERPRAQQMLDQTTSLLRDSMGIDPTQVLAFHELVSKAKKEIAYNDMALRKLSAFLDRGKAAHEPSSWSFLQGISLPRDDLYGEFVARTLYVVLDLERTATKSEEAKTYLDSVHINESHKKRQAVRSPKSLWNKTVVPALRGLISVAEFDLGQLTLFIRGCSWLQRNQGPGLALMFGVSASSQHEEVLKEHLYLPLSSEIASLERQPLLLDVADALLDGTTVSSAQKLSYARAMEALCVLAIGRKSGDTQHSIRRHFSGTVRMLADDLAVNVESITAFFAASTGDTAAYRKSVLQLLQDEAGMAPAVAAGLYSIGSGDIKGVEELAEMLDIDPGSAEGVVALSAGTPATVRGCLPGLLSSLEVNNDTGMAILGLCNDEATGIELLAKRLTEARPDRFEKMYSSLLCLPGLTSEDPERVQKALDGLMTNSGLTFENMGQAVTACMLVNGCTYHVSDRLAFSKLELDLAVFCAHLWKLDLHSFCKDPRVVQDPAQQWRNEMPGQYFAGRDDAEHELGAEALFAHMCSSELPNLLQRVAKAVGIHERLSPSHVRAAHEKEESQHGARPWALSGAGFLLTGLIYSGITGRFARVMEALEIEHDLVHDLKDMLEIEGGFRELFDICFGTEENGPTNMVACIIKSARNPFERRKKNKRPPVENVKDGESATAECARQILERIIDVPSELIKRAGRANKKVKESPAQMDYYNYLKAKLEFNCKNCLKVVLLVYSMGMMKLSPPAISTKTASSTTKLTLILRWAAVNDKEDRTEKCDGKEDFVLKTGEYYVERPSKPLKRKCDLMRDVEWDNQASNDTMVSWKSYMLLCAQFVTACLSTYDDANFFTEFDIVDDGVGDSPKFVNTLKYRRVIKKSRKGDDSDGKDFDSFFERRRVNAQTDNKDPTGPRAMPTPMFPQGRPISDLERHMPKSAFIQGTADKSGVCAKARDEQLNRVCRVLTTADQITTSSITTYGEELGGYTLGLLWNDVTQGHSALFKRASQIIFLPTNFAPVLMALASRRRGHPTLLPRFESDFFPPEAGRAPSDQLFKAEGSGNSQKGMPPKILTDASGVPNLKVPVPPEMVRLFKEINHPKPAAESLYQLVRVTMQDSAFLALNEHSVAIKLKINKSICFGLCAGGFVRDADSYSEPDLELMMPAVERVAATVGVSEKLAAMAISASAGNIDQLRKLTTMISLRDIDPEDLDAVATKKGVVAGLTGLITGEKAWLLATARLSKERKVIDSNIDVLCFELLKATFGKSQDKTFERHQHHLRCVAGVALSEDYMVMCTKQLLPGAVLVKRLHRIDPAAMMNRSKLREDGKDGTSLIFNFEKALVANKTSILGPSYEYRRLFEALMDIKRVPPDIVEATCRAGKNHLRHEHSWVYYVVDGGTSGLWDGCHEAIHNDVTDEKFLRKLALEGRQFVAGMPGLKEPDPKKVHSKFSYLCSNIVMCFSGQSVAKKKTFGLVKLYECLRPKPFGEIFAKRAAAAAVLRRQSSAQAGPAKATAGLPAAAAELTTWGFLDRMAQTQLGRGAHNNAIELIAFRKLVKHCFNGGVAAARFVCYKEENSTKGIETSGIGTGARFKRKMMGARLREGDPLVVVAAGGAYGDPKQVHITQMERLAAAASQGQGAVLKLPPRKYSTAMLDLREITIEVEQTSNFLLSDAAIECILMIVGEAWSAISGIEPDEPTSKIQVVPPPATRTNEEVAAQDTPGWKLLKRGSKRPIPNLVVGSGRRAILALRRLRCFINLGKRTVTNTPLRDYKAEGDNVAAALSTDGAPMVTMATEVFGMLQGCGVPNSQLVLVYTLAQLLNRNIEALTGTWQMAPMRLSSVIQQTLKPAIDFSKAEKTMRYISKEIILRGAKQRKEAKILANAMAASGNVSDDEEDGEGGAAGKDLEKETDHWIITKHLIDTLTKESGFFTVDKIGDPSSADREKRLQPVFDGLQKNVGPIALIMSKTRKNPDTGESELVHKEPVLETLNQSFDYLAEISTTLVHKMFTTNVSLEEVKTLVTLVVKPNIEALDLEEFANTATVSAVPTTNEADQAFVVQESSMLLALLKKCKLLAGQPQLVVHLEELVTSMGKMTSVTDYEHRKEAFLPGETLGSILSDAGFGTDLKQLEFMDEPIFWSKMGELLTWCRVPPDQARSGPKEVDTWSKKIKALLVNMVGANELGLLGRILTPGDAAIIRAVSDEMQPKLMALEGSMGATERASWFREKAAHVIEGLAKDEQKTREEEGMLLAAAMLLYNVWTLDFLASPASNTQNSLNTVVYILKNAVQLSVENALSQNLKKKAKKFTDSAKRSISLAHSFIDFMIKLPNVFLGELVNSGTWIGGTALDMDSRWEWNKEDFIIWGSVFQRLLDLVSETADIVEKIIGVKREDSLGEVLAVFQVLQQTCDNYENVNRLASAMIGVSDDSQGDDEDDEDELAEQEAFTTIIGEDDDPAEADMSIGRVKARTPSANFADIMLSILSHAKSQSLLPSDDFSIARDLVQAMYYADDDGNMKLDNAKFRPMARRLLKAVEVKCGFSDKATSQRLKDEKVPPPPTHTHAAAARARALSTRAALTLNC